jgi:hypothetical protein
MQRFKTQRFKDLIKELSQDPAVKAALDKISHKSKLGQHVKSLKDFLPILGKFSAKFGGKKTIAVTETITLIVVLFEVSVLIKQNMFDRPEVKRFFNENWGIFQKRTAAMYQFVSHYVKTQLRRRQAPKREPDQPRQSE